MPPDYRNQLPHLLIKGTAQSEDYVSPNQAPRPKYPERIRAQHANHLLTQVRQINSQVAENRTSLPIGAPAPDGIYLEIEGQLGYDLKLESLNLPSEGIEVLSARTVIGEDQREKTVATIFVQDVKVAAFIKKIEKYRDDSMPSGSPKNAALVNGIENIRLAVVRSLWTDLDSFPNANEPIWWEIWLRATPDSIPRFNIFAQARDIRVSQRQLIFPDRHVVLAYTTAEMLASCIVSLTFVAELRRAKETTAEFLQMQNSEQLQWAEALQGLTNLPDRRTSPVVCVLDTGVDRQHLLINQFLAENKLLTCEPRWRTNDHSGHGTQMTGLVLYGSLENALQSTERIFVPCEVESVKILPPVGENDPELYGNITEEAVNRATIVDPDRERIICMAITATDFRDRGQPSSWSASLDKVCVGTGVADKRHLFIVSAGNTDANAHAQYPESNITDQIHDPAQSWNALTVGAYTDKVTITENGFAGWTPLAPAGDIAPGSTTSVTWKKTKWPIKPDVVFEGGNAAINRDRSTVDYPNSLLLLTTNRNNSGSMFTWMADTSAATAQAANMAAILSNENPTFWPETLRALIVHSAEWTPRMKSAYPIANKNDRESLLRTCGYGVPDLNRARWSATNHLTLIAQDELRPFEGNRMKDLNIHTIPWPAADLKTLGATPVKMKVTLSYFIEPNPARRGWNFKFSYQSHGLRFDVKTPLESPAQFATRVNRDRWGDNGRKSITSTADSTRWYFGDHITSKGSIHSDAWEGTAAELAERNQIAISPVMGWWREKHSEGHTEKTARYSLIVSISTPSTKVDLYTPIENQIVAEVER